MKLKIKNKENIYLSPYTPITVEFEKYLKNTFDIDIDGYIDSSKDGTNIYKPKDIQDLSISNILILSPNWGKEIYDNLTNFLNKDKLTIMVKSSKGYNKSILNIRLIQIIDKLILKLINNIFGFYNIQIIKLWTHRIGELCLENEAFLDKIINNKSYKNKNFIVLSYLIEKDISNRTLYDLYKNIFRKYKNIFFLEKNIFNKYLQYALKNKLINKKLILNIEQKSNAYELFTNKKPIIKFTKKDIINGDKILKKLNITKPFVCIFARDSKYTHTTFKHYSWSHNDYRNFDIDTYELTIKYLIEKGYIVVRIGNIVSKELAFKHPQCIDYPYSDFQSDFMDIFLISKCQFIMGSTSGLVDVSCAFSIPRIGVNYMPIDHAPYSTNKDIFIPKKLIYKNKYLGLEQYLALIQKSNLSHWDTNTYDKLGITIENNTGKEILAVVKEYLGDYGYNKDDELNQQKYQQIHLKSKQFKEVKTKIGTDFLRTNNWFIK